MDGWQLQEVRTGRRRRDGSRHRAGEEYMLEVRPSGVAILMSVVQLLDVLLVVYVYLRFTELVCRVCTPACQDPGGLNGVALGLTSNVRTM